MSKKRRTKDFNIPGQLRYSERNPRGKKAEWIEFACTKEETDVIMQAIGIKIMDTNKSQMPAGKLLAEICSEWIEAEKK
jgi:hypothetical protein